MTHKNLIKIGKRWLKLQEKCNVIISEKSNGTEIPDILGFKTARHSVIIECKTSRSDFRADAKKWFRQENLGMGQTRYFLAPLGIIPKEELPPGWGLLEVDGNAVITTIKCDLLCFNEMRCWAEMPLLIAVIRKLQWTNYNLRKELRKKAGSNKKR